MSKYGKIDVLVTSASRVDLLARTMADFLVNMKYGDGFRLILHEDFVIPKESEAVIEWAIATGKFDLILTHEPPIRMGKVIYELKDTIASEFFIHWEDDWEFPHEVYLVQLLDIMDKFPHINQIAFNQSSNTPMKDDMYRAEREFLGLKFMVLQEWSVGPGVWRTSHVVDKWPSVVDAHDAVRLMGCVKNKDIEAFEQEGGCYFYGGHGAPAYIEHIGNFRSTYLKPYVGRNNNDSTL